MRKVVTHSEYPVFLATLKQRILQARSLAARAVNGELVLLYWDIGQSIVEKQRVLGWGESVIDRLSSDLQAAFPQSTGYSSRNLRDMKRLYVVYSDTSIWRQAVAKSTDTMAANALRQLVAEVPWGHNLLILNKLTDSTARLYYLRATSQFGWSRNVLLNQIKADSYERAMREEKTHNFPLVLPEHLAEQADEMLKSRYNLEFLGIHQAIRERELEDRLITHLQLRFKGRLPSARQLADVVRGFMPEGK